jgi:hypothetical protein
MVVDLGTGTHAFQRGAVSDARKWTRSSVTKESAVLSASLWRPRGADAANREMGSLRERKNLCLKT